MAEHGGIGGKRHHRKDQEGRQKRNHRRQGIGQSLDIVGNDTLFEDQFDGVSNRLEQAVGPGVARPDALLHKGQDLPFHIGRISHPG